MSRALYPNFHAASTARALSGSGYVSLTPRLRRPRGHVPRLKESVFLHRLMRYLWTSIK